MFANINLNGKVHRLHFNRYADFELNKIYNTDKSFDEEYTNNPPFAIMKLIYCGLIGYYYSQLQEMPYTLPQVAEMSATLSIEELHRVQEAFIKSRNIPNVIPNEKMVAEGEAEEKKKAPKPMKK